MLLDSIAEYSENGLGGHEAKALVRSAWSNHTHA